MRKIFSYSVTSGVVAGWIVYLAGTAYFQGQECFSPQLSAGPLLGAAIANMGATTGTIIGSGSHQTTLTLQYTQQAAFNTMKSAIQLAFVTVGAQSQANIDQILNSQWICYSMGQTQTDFEKCFQQAMAAVTKAINAPTTGGRKLLFSTTRSLLSTSSDCGWRLSLQWWTVALQGLISALVLVVMLMEHRPLFTRVKLLTACYLCINSTLMCGVASFYLPLSDTLWSGSASTELFTGTAITTAGLISVLVFNFLWLANWTLIEDNGVVVPDFRKGPESGSFQSDKDVLPEFKKADVI